MDTLIATKKGMTQLWTEDGSRHPVTVLAVEPNVVTAVRTSEKDGYQAVQLGSGAIRAKLVAKPQLGAFGKVGVEPRRHLREVRGAFADKAAGDSLDCSVFSAGVHVDVIGTSKGKGFQGTVKLHNFSCGPKAHGSDNVRKPGSIGMHTHPGRTLKGKRMPARMGNERVTIKHLEVLSVDAESGTLLVRGAVPGNNGGLVLVRKSAIQPKGGKR